MKKSLLLTLLFATVALADDLISPAKTYVRKANDTTAPVYGNGVDLFGRKAFRVSICAPSGDQLDGGTLQAWLYDRTLASYSRVSEWDKTVSNNGGQCETFSEQAVLVPHGELAYVCKWVGHMVALQDGGENFYATDGGRISIQIRVGGK